MYALWGFIIRELSIEKKYRFNIAIKTAAVFFHMAVFYYVSKYISPDYFPFVFIGIVFSQFFVFWLNAFSESIRHDQFIGTAEILFCSPTHPLILLAGGAAGKAVLFCAEFLLFLGAGILVFHVSLHWSWAIPAMLIVQTLIWASMGLAAASIVMYIKRGDPVSWVVSTMVDLLSGVYFPITILPQYVQHVSRFFPTTVALTAWRMILQNGQTVPAVTWLYLLFWAVICCAGAIFTFSQMFTRVRKNGDLGSY